MMPRLPGKLDWLMPTIILPSFPNSILGRSDGCAALALMVLAWLSWNRLLHHFIITWTSHQIQHYIFIIITRILISYSPPGISYQKVITDCNGNKNVMKCLKDIYDPQSRGAICNSMSAQKEEGLNNSIIFAVRYVLSRRKALSLVMQCRSHPHPPLTDTLLQQPVQSDQGWH